MGEKSAIRLPNTFEAWPRVSENLLKIRGGQVRDVQEFEELYTQLECSPKRAEDAKPNFATLRRVLKDANHISERHFLDTLLPWIAGKALEVGDLFTAQGHEISVREQPYFLEIIAIPDAVFVQTKSLSTLFFSLMYSSSVSKCRAKWYSVVPRCAASSAWVSLVFFLHLRVRFSTLPSPTSSRSTSL